MSRKYAKYRNLNANEVRNIKKVPRRGANNSILLVHEGNHYFKQKTYSLRKTVITNGRKCNNYNYWWCEKYKSSTPCHSKIKEWLYFDENNVKKIAGFSISNVPHCHERVEVQTPTPPSPRVPIRPPPKPAAPVGRILQVTPKRVLVGNICEVHLTLSGIPIPFEFGVLLLDSKGNKHRPKFDSFSSSTVNGLFLIRIYVPFDTNSGSANVGVGIFKNNQNILNLGIENAIIIDQNPSPKNEIKIITPNRGPVQGEQTCYIFFDLSKGPAFSHYDDLQGIFWTDISCSVGRNFARMENHFLKVNEFRLTKFKETQNNDSFQRCKDSMYYVEIVTPAGDHIGTVNVKIQMYGTELIVNNGYMYEAASASPLLTLDDDDEDEDEDEEEEEDEDNEEDDYNNNDDFNNFYGGGGGDEFDDDISDLGNPDDFDQDDDFNDFFSDNPEGIYLCQTQILSKKTKMIHLLTLDKIIENFGCHLKDSFGGPLLFYLITHGKINRIKDLVENNERIDVFQKNEFNHSAMDMANYTYFEKKEQNLIARDEYNYLSEIFKPFGEIESFEPTKLDFRSIKDFGRVYFNLYQAEQLEEHECFKVVLIHEKKLPEGGPLRNAKDKRMIHECEVVKNFYTGRKKLAVSICNFEEFLVNIKSEGYIHIGIDIIDNSRNYIYPRVYKYNQFFISQKDLNYLTESPSTLKIQKHHHPFYNNINNNNNLEIKNNEDLIHILNERFFPQQQQQNKKVKLKEESNNNNNKIELINTISLIGNEEKRDSVYSSIYFKELDYLISCSYLGNINIHDLSTNKLIENINHQRFLKSSNNGERKSRYVGDCHHLIKFSSKKNNKSFLVACYDGTLREYELTKPFKLLKEINIGFSISKIIKIDENTVICRLRNSKYIVVDVPNEKVIREYCVGDFSFNCGVVSKKFKDCIYIPVNGSIKLLNWKRGIIKKKFKYSIFMNNNNNKIIEEEEEELENENYYKIKDYLEVISLFENYQGDEILVALYTPNVFFSYNTSLRKYERNEKIVNEIEIKIKNNKKNDDDSNYSPVSPGNEGKTVINRSGNRIRSCANILNQYLICGDKSGTMTIYDTKNLKYFTGHKNNNNNNNSTKSSSIGKIIILEKFKEDLFHDRVNSLNCVDIDKENSNLRIVGSTSLAKDGERLKIFEFTGFDIKENFIKERLSQEKIDMETRIQDLKKLFQGENYWFFVKLRFLGEKLNLKGFRSVFC